MAPKTPAQAADADDAQGGQKTTVNPLTGQPGKYKVESQQVNKSLVEQIKEIFTSHRIGIRLEYQDKKKDEKIAMPNGAAVKFRIHVGKDIYEGELDDKGEAVVDGIQPETCKVSLPEIESSEVVSYTTTELK